MGLLGGLGDGGGGAAADLSRRLDTPPDRRGDLFIDGGSEERTGRQLHRADAENGQQQDQKEIPPGPAGGNSFFHALTTKKIRDNSCMTPTNNGIISKE